MKNKSNVIFILLFSGDKKGPQIRLRTLNILFYLVYIVGRSLINEIVEPI